MHSPFLACLAAFVGPIVITPYFIKIQKRNKIGQRIRQEGPDLHQHKSGTPTMGGIVIFLSIAISMIFLKPVDNTVFVSFLLMCCFGLVGLVDDIIKFSKGRSLGLKARNKIAFQLIISLLYLFWLFKTEFFNPFLIIPFKTEPISIHPFLYIPFITLVMISTTNAVNLTDGLDGLATGLIIIALITFAVIVFTQGKKDLFTFIFLIILSCSGFLFFNYHPAKIFLGDVGSLGLGGVLATIAVFSNTEIFLLLIAGVFVVETLSVIIQVFSIQLTKKPVFLMSPLHHHFEMMKWKEIHIVMMFWIFGILLALLGIIAYNF